MSDFAPNPFDGNPLGIGNPMLPYLPRQQQVVTTTGNCGGTVKFSPPVWREPLEPPWRLPFSDPGWDPKNMQERPHNVPPPPTSTHKDPPHPWVWGVLNYAWKVMAMFAYMAGVYLLASTAGM